MELSDLVQRIRRGDREALRALIAEYGAGVYRKAYQKTQDKELAREATRRTFAQLVTALQEHTDLDGWELWLNALTKRNIEACSNLRSDVAYMESALSQELFPEQAPPPRLSDGGNEQESAPARQESPATAQAFDPAIPRADAKRLSQQAERQAAQQQAVQQAEQYAAAQQQAQRQAEQYAAAQREAQRQAEQYAAAQRAAQQQAEQYAAAQQQASELRQAPVQPSPSAPAHSTQQRHGRHASAEKKSARRDKRATRLFEEDPGQNASSSNIAAAGLLALVCAILVWAAIGIMMSLDILPRVDLGYTWFNAHIFKFF